MAIKRKLFSSGIWWVSASLFNSMSTMVVFVLLARILTPVQFGIVAFATVFIDISRILVTAGIADALIQRNGWDQQVASTAFWTNCGLGAVIALILSLVVAPILAFYYDPIFSYVMVALSTLLLIEGTSTVHIAKLRRDFKDRAIAQRNMNANFIGGVVGVTLAYMGWGVWAMVSSRIAASTLTSILLWRASGFRPSFHYSGAELREFRRFSSHQLGSQLLAVGNTQVTALMIGAVLGPAAIAQYRVGSRALNMLISLVITPLQTASMSAFSRVHHSGSELGSAYLRVTSACALLTCPLFFGMAATAPDMIRVIFGPQWSQASYVMMMLALVVGPATLSYFLAPALSAAGRSGLTFMTNLSAFVGNLIVACFTVTFGPVAVSAGHTGRAHLTLPFSLYLLSKGIGIRPWQAVTNIAPPYLCAAAMALWVTGLRLYALEGIGPYSRFAISVGVGGLLYPALLLLFARRFTFRQLAELNPLLPKIVSSRLASLIDRFHRPDRTRA